MPPSKPKYPQYAVFSKRQVSFKNWPTHLGIDPDLLAEAGFVYTGVGDAVRCYHCGGGLRNWEQGDNPWWEHARWYSECLHMVLTKGQSFIDKVLSEDSTEDGSLNPNEPDKENNLIESPVTLSCVEMGYDKPLVQKTGKKYLDDKENDSSNNVSDSFHPSSGRSESEAICGENARVSSNSIANSAQSSLERNESEASSAEHESVSSNNIIDSVQPSSERNEPNNRSAENVALRIMNFNEDLLNHQVRQNTFANWPGRANCNTWELAYAGFHFHGIVRNADLLRCVFCGLLARDWRDGDSPWLYHARYSPECINFLAKKGLEYIYIVYNANPGLLTLQRALDLSVVYSGNMCGDLHELIDRGLRLTYTPYMYHLNDGTNYYPPRYPAFFDCYDRLQSFKGCERLGSIMGILELSQSGQVYHGSGTLTYCYYCGEEFSWNNGIEEPWEKHARKKPNCFHVIFSKGECFLEKALSGVQESRESSRSILMANLINAGQHNAFSGNDSAKLGIQMQKPKYPQYAVFSKRQESFKKWPMHLGIKPDALAEAGLVYTGVGDAVRCYHCGGGLRNWEQGDNPWREHAKWYSECPHVVLVKGQSFIDKVLNGDSIEEDCPSGQLRPNEPDTEEDVMESPAALSCVEMGYDRKLVQKAIEKYMEEKRHSYFKGMEIAQLCEKLQDCDISESVPSNNVADSVQSSFARSESEASSTENENIEELLEENQRLKDNVACKICLEDRATVIFLPCGHMVSCPQCAPALSKCPMCRDPVQGYVKAVFA